MPDKHAIKEQIESQINYWRANYDLYNHETDAAKIIGATWVFEFISPLLTETVDTSDGCEIDCGYDDRRGNHSHIWMSPKGVAEYCNELQAEIQELKQKLKPALKSRITCPACHVTRIIPREIAHITNIGSQCSFDQPNVEDIND